MPDTARILRFPARATASLHSRAEALARAQAFLDVPVCDRSEAFVDSTLADADILMSVCSLLWDLFNTSPSSVMAEAPRLYNWVSARTDRDFFFDERDFFLGESALLAGSACRVLGQREETERWLDRAEAGYRHTVGPAPHLARAAYLRLTLRFDMRRHEEVLELVPSVALTFQKLGMENELAKCCFLEAMSQKELGRADEAALGFENLLSREPRVDSGIRGMALLNLGNLRSTQGSFDVALDSYRRAAPLLQGAGRLVAVADLKAMIGETLRRMGHLGAALDAYRDAVGDLASLGISTRTAYLRLVLAEALIEGGKHREAEWEILAALPTIDEEKMAPEGFAAVALLRESVRQRKTDPKALLELREYLQAKN